jgi:hypothetical protein
MKRFVFIMISLLQFISPLNAMSNKQDSLRVFLEQIGEDSAMISLVVNSPDAKEPRRIIDNYNKKESIVDWQSFDSYFLTKVLHNEIIDVSEEFLQQRKPYSIKPVESINNLYETYGLDSLLKYLEEYPINQLRKDDLDSFDWSAYLLWQNNIYVSLDGEVYYWYIDYGE